MHQTPPDFRARLINRLVARGEFTRGDVRQVVLGRPPLPPEEALVLQGKITEKQLLAAMTEDSGIPFISSEQLAHLTVPRSALDRVPMEVAERLCILPLDYSLRRSTLEVAVATSSVGPEVSRALGGVAWTPLLACTFAIRAGIRLYYRGERGAFGALDARDEGLALEPKTQPDGPDVLQRATLLEEQQRVTDAIALLESALITSEAAPLFNKLALILFVYRRDLQRAERLLSRAVELDPGNAKYQDNLEAVRESARRFI